MYCISMHMNDEISFAEYEQLVKDGDMAPVRPLESAFRGEIEKLRRDLAEARVDCEKARKQHKEDIDEIGDYMMRLAQEEGTEYCDTYDKAVDTLNGKLIYKLPVRPKEYTVECLVTLTVSAVNELEAGAEGRKRVVRRMNDPVGIRVKLLNTKLTDDDEDDEDDE